LTRTFSLMSHQNICGGYAPAAALLHEELVTVV